MADFPLSKKILIFVNLAVYIAHLVLNGLAARGKDGDTLFPNSVSNISKTFHLELTPVGATFSIWGAIFTYQLIWIIYTTTAVCRSNIPSANILSSRFFIAFIVNVVFISAWLFVWAREMAIASLVVIVLGQICVDGAIAFALIDLKKFTDDQKVLNKTKVDVWFTVVVHPLLLLLSSPSVCLPLWLLRGSFWRVSLSKATQTTRLLLTSP